MLYLQPCATEMECDSLAGYPRMFSLLRLDCETEWWACPMCFHVRADGGVTSSKYYYVCVMESEADEHRCRGTCHFRRLANCVHNHCSHSATWLCAWCVRLAMFFGAGSAACASWVVQAQGVAEIPNSTSNKKKGKFTIVPMHMRM